MAKEFCPEFVEVELYNETVILPHNRDERVSVKVTQHHNCIFLIELVHWQFSSDSEKLIIRHPVYLFSGKEKVIRLAIEVFDDYCKSCIENGVKIASERVLQRLNSFDKMFGWKFFLGEEL